MPRQKRRQSRYRYVMNGTAVGTDSIKQFRLIAGTNMLDTYHGATALRVRIPKDLALTKYACDPYSTTDDTRTLDELGYDFMVRDNTKGKWVVKNEFKGRRPCGISLYDTRESLEKKKVSVPS